MNVNIPMRTEVALKKLPAVLTIRQVAQLMQVSEETVKRLCRDRKIKACKIGQQWRIRKDYVEAMLEGLYNEDLV